MMEQIHLLQSEIASSRNAEALLREEILELRKIIFVLYAVVCQRAENTPTREEDSAKKKKKKSKKKLSGGVPNRHKSSGEPGDSSSSDEVTSDEEALRGASHSVASRGRLVDGLCRKVKFYYHLPGSPSGRPLIDAPNRAVLVNSWNGYEGYLII
jgi:hypothetical protein